jgi:secreted trypsin-like serine protease
MLRMRYTLVFVLLLLYENPSLAITGKALPATGLIARSIVMLVDDKEDVCTATAIRSDLVLTAAHCVIDVSTRVIKIYQTGTSISVSKVVSHPQFDAKAYAQSRATADLALLKLEKQLPDIIAPVEIAPSRRVHLGESLIIAGFGVTQAFTPYGIGIPRQAHLSVTGRPGSLQIRLVDPTTANHASGKGACTGDSGAPAFDSYMRIVGVVSWSTGPNDEEGCGGLTGLTPLLLYRQWLTEMAGTL